MNDRSAEATSLAPYLQNYLSKARGTGIHEALSHSLERVNSLFGTVSEDHSLHRYAEGKWSIREMLQHMNDTERIFAYRALRFAREDRTPLAGFEENDYAPASRADRLSLASLLDEHRIIRQGTFALYQSFDERMLGQQGKAGGNMVGVRTLGLIIAGHAEHHCDILEERYR